MLTKKRIVYVDIDGTLCDVPEADYEKAMPIKKNIKKINELYKKNTIILWTARGSTTCINWYKTTQAQLKKWGCKYHELRMGKPYYDLWIDDKTIKL